MTLRSSLTGVPWRIKWQIKKSRKRPETLRSARWFAPDDLRAFGHRSRAMQMGYAPEEWKDRPVIAILNNMVGRAALPHAFQEPRR